MKIVVTANGPDLESAPSPQFGRCPIYIFIDSDSMEFEAVENPATDASGGAGIKAAQFVVEHGAKAVVTGNIGPNAFDVLEAAGIPVYSFSGGTVQEAVEGYRQGVLSVAGSATVSEHAGLGGGQGRRQAAQRATPHRQPEATTVSATNRQKEVAVLKDMARDLRKQLVEVMERLERLEKGD